MNIHTMFSEIAPTYDKMNRWLSFSRDKQWRTRAAAAITNTLDLRCLDLCAGTLDMTVAILRRLPHANITAVDFSGPMLKLGVEKVPHVFRAQVDIREEDALHLSLPDHSVDTVVCAFGMRNLPDQARALEQIYRVLAPGGELILLEFFQPETRSAKFFARTYGRYGIPLLGNLLSHHKTAYRYLRDSTAAYYPLSAYRALLRQHHFTIRHVEQLSRGVASLIVAEVR